MKADIGFILIGLGLVGVYIALGGKFGKSGSASSTSSVAKTADQVGIANMGTIQPGGASQPANVPDLTGSSTAHETPKDPSTGGPVGSGGVSVYTRLTQFGHILALHPTDRRASFGGFR